ncbi:hypothetical protein FW789_22305 [Pseudomonas sp. 1121_17]
MRLIPYQSVTSDKSYTC